MSNRNSAVKAFGKVDLLVVVGLFIAVVAWMSLWAFPYPHPELWSDLAVAARTKSGTSSVLGIWLFPTRILFLVFGVNTGLAVLALLGKAALGVSAAAIYLGIRKLWVCYRPPIDSRDAGNPYPFLFTKFLAMVAALVFAFSPFAWHTFQHLSPDALLLSLAVVATTAWVFGRRAQNMWYYTCAFLLCGVMAASHSSGFLLAVTMVVCDSFERWRMKIVSGRLRPPKIEASDEYDVDEVDQAKRDQRIIRVEKLIMTVSFLFGFGAALYFARRAAVWSGVVTPGNYVSTLGWWTSAVFGSFRRLVATRGAQASVVFAILAGVSVMVAWRLHVDERRPECYWEKRFFSAVLAVLAFLFICRNIDAPERARLATFRDHAALVAEEVDGARWFFTDGRLDDTFRLALAERGASTTVLSVMSLPNGEEMRRLRSLAPESGDREIFSQGGSEVFAAWARERPDRLRESAWQLGGRLIGLHGQIKFHTYGGVMRDVDTLAALGEQTVGKADRAMRELSQRLISVTGVRTSSGDLFGSVDELTATKFDALLWRAARLASERYTRLTELKSINEAQKEREIAARLDELNGTLKLQGEYIERMLPTERLILTPKEALDVALKRADFPLARKYANQVLVSFPDDHAAHFALAMASMLERDYGAAARHFEIVKMLRPNEAATLNNLSLCYMKLGRYEDALRCAEKASQLQPGIERIQKNLQELKKKISTDEERNRNREL